MWHHRSSSSGAGSGASPGSAPTARSRSIPGPNRLGVSGMTRPEVEVGGARPEHEQHRGPRYPSGTDSAASPSQPVPRAYTTASLAVIETSRRADSIELGPTHRLRKDSQHPLVVRPLVGRPGHVLRLHDRLGRADEGRGTLEFAAVGGDGRQPADGERLRELVADALTDLEGLPRERLGRIKVPELPLDHAEVAGLRSDQELVAGCPDERQPLGHPVAGFRQVAGDLGADAEEVQRVRSPGFVRRRPR